jgi:hypothetical protein
MFVNAMDAVELAFSRSLPASLSVALDELRESVHEQKGSREAAERLREASAAASASDFERARTCYERAAELLRAS